MGDWDIIQHIERHGEERKARSLEGGSGVKKGFIFSSIEFQIIGCLSGDVCRNW